MAVNCLRVPRSSCGFAGVMAIETRIALVIVNVTWPATPDNLAVTVTEPVERLDAKPEPEIVATLLLEDDHTTEAVISWLVPSR